jgi:hypothetical protein
MAKPNKTESDANVATFTIAKDDPRLPIIGLVMGESFIMPAKTDLVGLVKLLESDLVANCGDGAKRYSHRAGDLPLVSLERCLRYGYQRFFNDAFNRPGKDAALESKVKIGDAVAAAMVSGLVDRITTGMNPTTRDAAKELMTDDGVALPKVKNKDDKEGIKAREAAIKKYYDEHKAEVDAYAEKLAALEAERVKAAQAAKAEARAAAKAAAESANL